MGGYLGVDLHRNCFTVCALVENGRRHRRRWALRDLEKLAATLRPDDAIAVEVTTNTRFFYEAVAPRKSCCDDTTATRGRRLRMKITCPRCRATLNVPDAPGKGPNAVLLKLEGFWERRWMFYAGVLEPES